MNFCSLTSSIIAPRNSIPPTDFSEFVFVETDEEDEYELIEDSLKIYEECIQLGDWEKAFEQACSLENQDRITCLLQLLHKNQDPPFSRKIVDKLLDTLPIIPEVRNQKCQEYAESFRDKNPDIATHFEKMVLKNNDHFFS